MLIGLLLSKELNISQEEKKIVMFMAEVKRKIQRQKKRERFAHNIMKR